MTSIEIAAMAMQGMLAGNNTAKMTDQAIANKSRHLAECLVNEMKLPHGSRAHDRRRPGGIRNLIWPEAKPEEFK